MIQIAGEFFDGENSACYPALLSVSDSLQISVRVGPGEETLKGFHNSAGSPVDCVELGDVRLGAVLAGCPRTVDFAQGARFQTMDTEGFAQLCVLKGEHSASRIAAWEGSWRTAVAAIVVTVGVVVVCMIWAVPFVAKRVAGALPEAIVTGLGRGTVEALDKALFVESTSGVDQRARLRQRFSVMLADRGIEAQLEFRGMGVANAFAFPDGTIIVTDELLDLAENDDEIMAVLAHEVAHLKLRHGVRMVLESSAVATLATVVLGDLTALSTLAAAMPSVYAEASYSRDHESEADEFALQWMIDTGLDPRHFARILGRLSAAAGESATASASDYMASHPPTRARIEMFEAASAAVSK